MTQCPTCKLTMESHSTSELMECCMKQLCDEGNGEETQNVCPNCQHEIIQHSNQQLAECTIAYLKSDIREWKISNFLSVKDFWMHKVI